MREVWKQKRIAELILPSGTRDPRKAPSKRFRYVDVSSVSNERFEITEVSELLGSDAPSRARRQIQSGDVIFATIRPTLKRIATVPETLDGEICSTGFFVFRCKPEILSKFIFYHLFTDEFMGEMEALQSGASYPAVSDSQVKSQVISFPPLAEQKRIVAILDEAFEGIDAAIANTEKNLANARELFDSYLNTIFSHPGEGWISGSLAKIAGTVCTGPFGSLLHKSDYVENGIPLINPANIRHDRIIPDAQKAVSSETLKRLRSYILEEGDLVVGRRGEIGRCAVVTDQEAGWLCGTGCFFIRPNKNVLPEFLVHLIRSRKYRSELENLSTGATMQNLSNKSLGALNIKLPNQNEQKFILSLLDDLSEKIDNIQFQHERKLEQLAHLKQSLLAKAFSGDLTAGPDKALQEAAA